MLSVLERFAIYLMERELRRQFAQRAVCREWSRLLSVLIRTLQDFALLILLILMRFGDTEEIRRAMQRSLKSLMYC